MHKSETIGKLADALAKAQAQIKTIGFDATNPFFKSKYTTLTAIMENVRPLLAEFGLSIINGGGTPHFNDKGHVTAVEVEGILVHASGEWISVSIVMPVEAEPITKGSDIREPNPQSVGSAVSYGRRYVVSALLALATDEDTDGNHPSRDPRQQQTKRIEPTKPQVQADDPKREWDGTDADALGYRFPVEGSPNYGKPMGEMTDADLQKFVAWAGVKPAWLNVRLRAEAILTYRSAK